MRRLVGILTLAVAVVMVASLHAQQQNAFTLFTGRDILFQPTPLAPGAMARWTFRAYDDNAIARVVIDSQGSYYGGFLVPNSPWRAHGSAPDGYSELVLIAQDETVNINTNQVAASSLHHMRFRVMSKSYGFMDAPPYHPATGHCRGTQCPGMSEIYADGDFRFTSGGGGSITFVVNNRDAFKVTPQGDYYLPLLTGSVDWGAAGGAAFLCLNSQGRVYASAAPCR